MAWVMWFTGLPGCGKTTIAMEVKKRLQERGIEVKILQLDEIRRDIVYASLAYMGKILAEENKNVIIDATANRRRYRDLARQLIPNFAEVFIRAPLEVCMDREERRNAVFSPKDIYKKAGRKNALVPGVNVAYEDPISPEIEVDAAVSSPLESSSYIADRIAELYGSA